MEKSRSKQVQPKQIRSLMGSFVIHLSINDTIESGLYGDTEVTLRLAKQKMCSAQLDLRS